MVLQRSIRDLISCDSSQLITFLGLIRRDTGCPTGPPEPRPRLDLPFPGLSPNGTISPHPSYQ